MMPDIQLSVALFYFVMPGLFLVAGFFDVLTTRIPDWISISLVALFLANTIVAGLPLADIAMHFGVGLIVFFAGFLAFSFGWMGGGDGKLAAAGALWFGPGLAASFIMLSFVFGAALVALVFTMRHFKLPAFMVRQAWLMKWVQGDEGLPFGLAMAAAVMVMTRIDTALNVF